MKVLGSALITMLWLWYTASQACEMQEWQGHRIYCCANGTAIESKIGQKVWVAQKPRICNLPATTKMSEQTNLPKVIILTVIIVASVCVCLWKCLVQKVRRIIRFCKTETEDENQVNEMEVKVMRKMPKSQSF